MLGRQKFSVRQKEKSLEKMLQDIKTKQMEREHLQMECEYEERNLEMLKRGRR